MKSQRTLLATLLAIALGLSISGCAAAEAQPAIDEEGDVRPVMESGEEEEAAASLEPEDAVSSIDESLQEALSAAESGDYERAERLRAEAFLIFEGGVEKRLESRNPELKAEIEDMFWQGSESQPGLATLIADEAPADQLSAKVSQIHEELEEAEGFLGSTMTPPVAFLNSMAIIVREGLEAVLIISAILGYMKTTRRKTKYYGWVLLGVVAAVVLSLGIWQASMTLFHITAANRELFEGITSLIAVGVLFYVTNWIFHKVYVVDWMAFIKEEVGNALRTGSLLGLAFLSFTVVFREGFETVLFYQALSFDAPAAALFSGFAVGVAIITGIAFLILKLSGRIPVRLFFTATGIMMLALAFHFSGAGVHALQEAGLVSMSALPLIPRSELLSGTLGIFPTWETILAQGVFLLLVGATVAISRWRFSAKQARRVLEETH